MHRGGAREARQPMRSIVSCAEPTADAEATPSTISHAHSAFSSMNLRRTKTVRLLYVIDGRSRERCSRRRRRADCLGSAHRKYSPQVLVGVHLEQVLARGWRCRENPLKLPGKLLRTQTNKQTRPACLPGPTGSSATLQHRTTRSTPGPIGRTEAHSSMAAVAVREGHEGGRTALRMHHGHGAGAR